MGVSGWGSAKDVIRKELEELPRAARKVARGFLETAWRAHIRGRHRAILLCCRKT